MKTISIICQNGSDNDFSLCCVEVDMNNKKVKEFFKLFETEGYSVRGTKEEILEEISEIL